MNSDELDLSVGRLLDSEDSRTRTTGLGTTKQGQALARQYRQQVADRIAEDRAYGRRDKDVWRALKGNDDNALAIRLLVAGISVSEPGELGADDNGEKNFRDQARFIGRSFGQQRKLGLRVGAWGINALLDLPVFALDTGDVLKLTASADAFMDDVLARAVKANPLLTPLHTPPDDWTQVRTGGLPADHWAKVPLIREHHRSIENAVREAISRRQMGRVLDAINALQRVPFVINEPLLEFMLRAVEVPQGFDVDMVTAEAMACVERFWVPLNIDFRGRINPIPHFNFTREDHVRALFLFADGERIGEDGLLWLKNHVAGTANGNTWSRVKKPGDLGTLKDRVAWTEANLEELRSVGRAVLRGDDPAKLAWALPSKPYQFLAACVELVQALDAGPDFITRLPVTFDATCSGLQHLCAMTRAEEGRYANLVPDEEADDFYRRVAYRVWKEGTASWSHWGLFSLSDFIEPFDRDIVKQPAMSYFYGSRPGGFSKFKDGRWRPYGMTKQVIDVLKERNQSTKGAKEFAHAIYEAIEGMVPRATAVRDFLEELARLCAKEGKQLRWPMLGLPVINCYYKSEKERIAVSLNGRRRRVNFVVGDTEDINETKAANAVTANFIHSVDAAHLQLIATAAAKEGIPLVTVHDCFGTIAPRAARLKQIIPEQLVYLHKRHNVLASVWASARRDLPKHIELPPLPETGDLEIEQVLASFNAFK